MTGGGMRRRKRRREEGKIIRMKEEVGGRGPRTKEVEE